MKIWSLKEQQQFNHLINGSQASTKDAMDSRGRSESQVLINSSLLSESAQLRKARWKPFNFGSKVLAIIYMANTMVIPEMNQVVDFIVFTSPEMLLLTTMQYLAVLTSLVIPSYMMILQCEQENSPFYHQIISKYNPRLSSMFLYANMGINVLAIFNLLIKFLDSIILAAPFLYTPFHKIVCDKCYVSDFGFLCTWFGFFAGGVVTLYIIQQYSYFENFFKIQGRLIITFAMKWIVFITIFIIIFFEKSCEDGYIKPDNHPSKNFAEDITFAGLVNYYTSVLYCLSFPFVEVYMLKRETQTHSESTFKHPKDVFRAQFILRSTFFFLQIFGWGMLYALNGEGAKKCNQQLGINNLMMTLMFFTIITVPAIYANNYSLNRQMQKNELYINNRDNHIRNISEAYNYSALLLAFIFFVVSVLRFVIYDYWEFKYIMTKMTQSCQALLFFFTCIATPIYVAMQQQERPCKRVALQLMLLLITGISAVAFVVPIVTLFTSL